MTNTNVFPIHKANRLTCRWITSANGHVRCVWTLGAGPSRATNIPSQEAESQAVRLCA